MSDLEQILLERKQIKDEIRKLQEKDRDLYVEQMKLFKREPAELPIQQMTTNLELPSLEIPENHFWKDDRVGLISYPRSGNSLVRRIIEQLTGTVTGSDGRPDRPLIRQLAELGMKGEGLMDSQVWCVKSHFPERIGRDRLTIQRSIIIVRNPFDSILSFFHMMMTYSHSKSVSFDAFNAYYTELWADFLFEELSVWIQFHEQWKGLEGLIVRYEDMVQHRPDEVRRLSNFLYNPHLKANPSLRHEVLERIDELLAKPQHELGIYKPKNVEKEGGEPKNITPKPVHKGVIRQEHLPLTIGKGGYLKSIKFFTKEQYQHVLATARDQLVRFGYWDTCVDVQKEHAPDMPGSRNLVPGSCIVKEANGSLKLNSKYGIRPRVPQDPYGRGFEIRWKQRLSLLPKFEEIEMS